MFWSLQVNYYTVNRLPIKGAEHVSLKAPLCEQLLWPSWPADQADQAAVRGRVVIGVPQWLQLEVQPFDGTNHLSVSFEFCQLLLSFLADQSAWQLHSIHLAWSSTWQVPRKCLTSACQVPVKYLAKYLPGTWQVTVSTWQVPVKSWQVPDKYQAMYLASTWPSNVQFILQPLSPVHIVPEPHLWYCNSYNHSNHSLSDSDSEKWSQLW